MNILFIATGTFSRNCMVKRAAKMAPHLASEGHSVTIVTKDTEENRSYLSTLEHADLCFPPWSGTITEVRQKAKLIRARNPDLVYACGWGVRNLPALLGNVSVVEHAELPSANHDSTALQRKKSLALEWMSVGFADGLVLVSKYLHRKYGRRDALGRTEQLYLPFGLDHSSASSDGVSGSEDEDPASKRVLFMGSLYESYGIFDIVRSAGLVAEEAPDVEYVIVGDGPDRKAAEELAHSLGVQDRVHFVGYVVDEDALDDYLASADIFLAPMFDTVKDKARCPSKIPMYMRYQRPIVTCEIGEAVSYLEDEGFYYEPGESRSMAREIVNAVRGPDRMNYDLERISWKRLAKRFLEWVRNDLAVKDTPTPVA